MKCTMIEMWIYVYFFPTSDSSWRAVCHASGHEIANLWWRRQKGTTVEWSPYSWSEHDELGYSENKVIIYYFISVSWTSLWGSHFNLLVWLCRNMSPAPRFDHTATVHANRYLLIFGGSSHSTCFSDLHVLDLQTVRLKLI